MIVRSILIAALLAATPAAAAPAQVTLIQAIQPHHVFPAQDRGQQRAILSLRDIVDMVRTRYGGELISARLEQGPRPVYVLRWRMPDSQVRDIRVDAASGQFR
ncbi:MAG: PepSY domain-containing protein [Hyphomonadaceae bacterium]